MKRKQVTALLMSGMLALGSVAPVMASETASSEITADVLAAVSESAQGDSKNGTNVADVPSTQKTAETAPEPSAPAPEDGTAAPAENEGSQEQQAPTEEAGTPAPSEGTQPDTAAPAEDAGTSAPSEGTQPDTAAPDAQPQINTTAPTDAAKPSEETPQTVGEASDFIDDASIQVMSNNLTALADQALETYNSMTKDEKDAIERVYGGQIDIPGVINTIKSQVTFEFLKKEIQGASNAEEADAILTGIDNWAISQIDAIKTILRDAKNFNSDYAQYLQEGLAIAIKSLQSIFVRDKLLYTEEYLAQAQKYYDEAITLKPGVQTNKYIVEFCDKVTRFCNEGDKHLNVALLDEALRAADAFDAFLACAPDQAIAQTEFNYGSGVKLTYGDIPAYVKNAVQGLKQSAQAGGLTYAELSNFSTMLYGNLMAAYDGVSAAILSSLAEQVKDAEYIGYTGDKKSAYEDALKKYNDLMAAKKYEALPGAVAALKDTAKAYAAAAEEYAKTEGKKQVSELKDKLTAIQKEVEAYSEYYNDTYGAEVKDAIVKLDSADLSTMTGRQITDMLNSAKAVIAKQSESYSQKLKDMVSNAQTLTAKANEWWAFLPKDMKAQAPYAEAIAMTNALTGVLAADNGLYNLDALIKAYDAFTSDFSSAGGKIQSAAKAVAQYVLDHAEEVYAKESKVKHTDGLLKAFRDAIDNLKASIAAWDFDGTRSAAASVKTAQANLLADKPAQEKEKKATPIKKTTKKTAVKTGDTSDASEAGLLALFSMTTVVGILGFKRKR